MTIIIFADNEGCARSIRGNCIQPCMGGGGSAMSVTEGTSSSVYTAQGMREMANAVDDVSINDNGEYYYEKHDKFNPDLVRDMLRQAADMMERDEKRFIIRSNDDGSVWVSPHRWLKGHCAKATIFSSAFYAKKAVEFENKSKSGRDQLPQVYEIMDDGRLRLVSEEECAK